MEITPPFVVAIIVLLVSLFYIMTSGAGEKKAKKNSGIANTDSNQAPPEQGAQVTYIGKISSEEVAKHNKASDAWIIVDGKVYDVTTYVDIHPGGDSILANVGHDSTEGFNGPQHPVSAVDVLATYLIGEIDDSVKEQ